MGDGKIDARGPELLKPYFIANKRKTVFISNRHSRIFESHSNSCVKLWLTFHPLKMWMSLESIVHRTIQSNLEWIFYKNVISSINASRETMRALRILHRTYESWQRSACLMVWRNHLFATAYCLGWKTESCRCESSNMGGIHRWWTSSRCAVQKKQVNDKPAIVKRIQIWSIPKMFLWKLNMPSQVRVENEVNHQLGSKSNWYFFSIPEIEEVLIKEEDMIITQSSYSLPEPTENDCKTLNDFGSKQISEAIRTRP